MAIPFTLVGIDHVVFLVDDMPRAMAFYRDVLGCVPGYTYPALGMEQVWAGAVQGVVIETEALHGGARGMGQSVYIRDPFGNTLEIKGPAAYPDGR